MNENHAAALPASAQAAVLQKSQPLPEDAQKVNGPNFDEVNPNDLSAILKSMESIGFQGTSVSEAVRIIEQMVRHETYSFREHGDYLMILPM